MAKKTHRRHQKKARGRRGRIEVHINGFLDVRTPKKVIEVERSGRFKQALRRLAAVRKPHKILKVPNKDLGKALRIARKRRQRATITNLSGTRYRYPR